MEPVFFSPHTGKNHTTKYKVEVRLYCTGYGWRGYTPNADLSADGLTEEATRSRIKYVILDYVVQTRLKKNEPRFDEAATKAKPGEKVFFMHIT